MQSFSDRYFEKTPLGPSLTTLESTYETSRIYDYVNPKAFDSYISLNPFYNTDDGMNLKSRQKK